MVQVIRLAITYTSNIRFCMYCRMVVTIQYQIEIKRVPVSVGSQMKTKSQTSDLKPTTNANCTRLPEALWHIYD